MKIHITSDCKTALEELGGYMIEPRGEIDIKVDSLFFMKLLFIM